MALFRLIPCAGERDPIGCWVQRWHRHRLVLSQRWNFLSIEGTWQVGGSNQVESIQTRHFCYASSGKKRRELFFLSLPFSFLIFSSVRNYCCEIRERTETSQRQIFITLEFHWNEMWKSDKSIGFLQIESLSRWMILKFGKLTRKAKRVTVESSNNSNTETRV